MATTLIAVVIGIILVTTIKPGSDLFYSSFILFSIYFPKLRTYFYVHLMDGAARIFPSSYAATENQTHVRSVALFEGPQSRTLY